MPSAYIVEAVRTAGGKKNGRLREFTPIDLGARVIDAVVDRAGIDGAHVEDVILGCVTQIGHQAGNIARNVVLASKLPESVPGTTVDRQCGSSQQAIHFAAQAVMSGVQDCVIAGGVECMTVVPIGANVKDAVKAGHGLPYNDTLNDKYGDRLEERGLRMFSQFEGAELLAEKHGLTRDEMDEFALASHVKAAKATSAGHFKKEIVPVEGLDKEGNKVVHDVDEGMRPNASLEQMKKLKVLRPKEQKGPSGKITAASSSQICDGAAAILICNEEGLRKLGLRPRAKIVALALAGSDPVIMLEGPIPATQNVLKQAKLGMKDIDLYEVNEAFASVPLAWAKALGADKNKLNVNGGAMALGHPLGGTGAKLMTTLLHELERRGGRYGLQAICEGGGTANATIIERIPAAGSKL
jgi:acetyl-CoA acetyltransferase family protein